MSIRVLCGCLFFVSLVLINSVFAQPHGMAGFPGMPGAGERQVLEKFDTNKNKWLESDERQLARVFVKENPAPQ